MNYRNSLIVKLSPTFTSVLDNGLTYTTYDIQKFVEENYFINDYYLLHNGQKLVKENDVFNNGTVEVVPRLRGGKGGFGSMLRAIGAQIEKTTNREACRDLSGRRLRDINEEKRLKKWISEQADRERQALENKKKKLEKLASEPKHEFKDEEYDKARSELGNKVHSAVEEGIKAATSSEQPSTSQGVKRKKDEKGKKKNMLWIDEEELDSDLSDSEEEEEEEDDSAKKQKVI